MLPNLNNQCIRANKKNNIIYLNNPKVGCSTVKFNLWKILDPDTIGPKVSIHDLEKSPFSNTLPALDWGGDANIFSFVRNPFTRIVSAYLNKIKGRNDNVSVRFYSLYGLPKDKEVSFGEFIEIISSNPAEYLDPHWRPQHINLMYPFVRPNFLGFLEDMDAQLPLVLSRYLNTETEQVARKDVHKTAAQTLTADYFRDPHIKCLFMRLYYYDFEYFGYSPDIQAPQTSRNSAVFSDHTHEPLRALVDYRNAATPAERLAVLERITGFEEVMHDPFVKSWHLNGRIENQSGPKKKRVSLIRDSLNEVLAGPEFLRRTAAGIAASAGEWALCTRIAAAGMR